MITRVTITGADNSINPADLLPLTREFPFVEWGILLSSSLQGQNRYPSFDWLLSMLYFKRNEGKTLALAGHLCGRWVRDILVGNHNFLHALTPNVWAMFDRIQINTHGQLHAVTTSGIALLNVWPEKEFIFQYDNVNNVAIMSAEDHEVNHSALFDLSHGAGKLPSEWPDLLRNTRCGYAGGLSPQNLLEQIERIEEKTADVPVWIDMETHVRSDNDRQFDLDKVYRCLEVASRFIKTPTV